MSRDRVSGRRTPHLAAAVIAIALAALATVAVPTVLAAEGERVFDPNLSLVGDCEVETLDPVEDPGCPTTTPPSSDHPGAFANPTAVAADLHGDIYVANFGSQSTGVEGRIDIFDPTGVFITEVESEDLKNLPPLALAIDSDGVLYAVVKKSGTKTQILRYTPCVYEPGAGEIEYCTDPAPVGESASTYVGIAINRDNDHLFANFGGTAVEFDNAEEGNPVIRSTVAKSGCCGTGIAVDADRDLLYVTADEAEDPHIRVFDLTSVVGAPPGQYELVGSIEDSSMPEGGNLGGFMSIAVDEGTGHVFVYDTENKQLYEFDEDGTYVATIEFNLQPEQGAQIGVDNGPTSPNKGYLYVPSHRTGVGHSFAFKESIIVAPEVKSPHAANVDEAEAELVAQINPGNAETTYKIEYTTEEGFDAKGFEGATVVGEGTLPAGNLDVEVSAVAAGLQEGTAYRFRVSAQNEKGDAVPPGEASFATYPSAPLEPAPCPNAVLRTGASALLPDCRAYELVTPPDTNGRAVLGTTREINSFTTRQVSPGGGALPFKVEGGSLPGFGGTGSFLGDPYLSTRTSGGWATSYIGPTGAETTQVIAGSTSPDQGYSFWAAQVAGTAVVEGKQTSYVRFPDGHSELVGQGSFPTTDPEAVGQLISEGGDHIIFTSAAFRERQKVTLGEETTGGTFTLSFQGQSTDPIPYDASAAALNAALAALPAIGPEGVSVSTDTGSYIIMFTGPLGGFNVPELVADPSGLTVSSGEKEVAVETVRQGGGKLEPETPEEGLSVYDRVPNPSTGERETKLVSLKPNGESFGTGEDATYMGASLDGEGIAFKVSGTLYLRYQNSETFAIGAGLTYAGLAEGGSRIFYLQGGDLKAFDSISQTEIEFTESGDVTPVFIAQGGTAAYIVSPSELTAQPNPNDEEPQDGAQNLYLSEEGQLSFVGVVTDRDVEGELIPGIEKVDGLGLWVGAANPTFPGRFGVVPARATPDGSVLLFKSRAALTDYDSGEIAQIYRYDSAAGELQCLSCNPTGAAPSTDATLQTERRGNIPLFFSQAWLENLRADGDRAFFESSEPLVVGDSDGHKDVYEWEADGVGSCRRPQGCLHLISSPRSLGEEYLWAVSQSGDDVFFLSFDLLLGADADRTASIYDARVGGGFPEDSPPICVGEGCRPQLTPPPPLPAAGTPVRGPGDNVAPRRCGKGKHKVKRNGKVRCVKKKKSNKQAKKNRAGTGEKGGRR